MLKLFIKLAILVVCVGNMCAGAPVVSNVQSSQSAGTKIVEIYYDLADSSGQPLSVSVYLSTNNGGSYSIKLSHLSGAVGNNVFPGIGKHITWDAGADTNLTKRACKIKVIASTQSNYGGTMITIPAGSFLMGNSGIGNDAVYNYSDELPQHWVYLSAYQIGKYEVTRGEYRKFINAGGYNNPVYWTTDGWAWKTSNGRTEPYYWAASQDWGTGTFTQTDNHPVAGVTYYEAEAYCKYAGGRLPTEAEWEKAARWTGSHPNVYPWGDTWDEEKCNNYYDTNSAGGGYGKYQTAPVGSYASGMSPYGLHDMAGNVWEWCADWYKSYPNAAQTFDYTNSYRCFRGGGWYSYYGYTRCACRNYSDPYSYYYSLGFRIAR